MMMRVLPPDEAKKWVRANFFEWKRRKEKAFEGIMARMDDYRTGKLGAHGRAIMRPIWEDLDGYPSYAKTQEMLVDAIMKHDQERVEDLLGKGAFVNGYVHYIPSINSHTPLMYACQKNNIYMIRLLLENGADPNALPSTDHLRDFQSDHGVLYVAAVIGNPEIVELLIDHGADPSFPYNERGRTPLMGACLNQEKATALLLVEKGADIHATEIDGKSALFIAAGNGISEIVFMLISEGADVNIVSRNGETPLLNASTYLDCPVTIHLLIDAGADINARDEKGETALARAVKNKFKRAESVLRHFGAEE